MPQPYRDDLAYIHDVGHGDFARRAAPGLLEMLRKRGICGGRVIDLGCGSGIWARQLLDAGYQVLGIDLSPAMIALAKKHAPGGEFRRQSFLRAELPSCAAVTSVSECFNYLFDKHRDHTAALTRLLRRIHGALQPGGVLVFDVLEPATLRRKQPLRRFREAEDWAVLVEIEPDEKRRQLTRHITSFRQVGKLFRRDSERHRVQLLDTRELSATLRSLGFQMTRLNAYGDLKLEPGHKALVAQKCKN